MEHTKRHLAYADYYDKVYGCFLGKCIGGTAGGPAEGRKELLDFPLNEELLHKCLPNDDLDLQILWLELIETKGFDITARDMADEFYQKVPYGPGEYAYFQRIMPEAFSRRFRAASTTAITKTAWVARSARKSGLVFSPERTPFASTM